MFFGIGKPGGDNSGSLASDPLAQELAEFIPPDVWDDMAEAIMAQNPGMTRGEANAAVKRFMAEVAKTPGEFRNYVEQRLYPKPGIIVPNPFDNLTPLGAFGLSKGDLSKIPEAEYLYAFSLSYLNKTVPVYAKNGNDSDPLTIAEQQSNAKYVFGFLSLQGWSREAIFGLFGNIQVESKFNPGAWEGYGAYDPCVAEDVGYGLLQWSSAAKFLNWAGLTIADAEDMANKNPRKLMDLQLEFFIASSQPGGGEWLLRSVNTSHEMSYKQYISTSNLAVGTMAIIFHDSYERSGDGPDGLNVRSTLAVEWGNFFLNGGASS